MRTEQAGGLFDHSVYSIWGVESVVEFRYTNPLSGQATHRKERSHGKGARRPRDGADEEMGDCCSPPRRRELGGGVDQAERCADLAQALQAGREGSRGVGL